MLRLEGVLRKTWNFAYIKVSYAKPKVAADSDLEVLGTKFKLCEGYISKEQPPIIIVDSDGHVSRQKLTYSLTPLSKEEIDAIRADLPESKQKALDMVISEYGPGSHPIFFRPVPALRGTSILRDLAPNEWMEKIVGDIVNHGSSVKDSRATLLRKALLLKGLKMSINPHAIDVRPGKTGRTEWADAVGLKEDKASASSLIGYADSDGPHLGTLHSSDQLISLDQMEEQGAYSIFKYLLSLLENGRARVDNAAYPFEVTSSSTVQIIANPFGDPKNDFFWILKHASRNPALGRRFGILLYDYDRTLTDGTKYRVPRIEGKDKDLRGAISDSLALFRAVEEFAHPRLVELVEAPEVWAWLNAQDEIWKRQTLALIEKMEGTQSTTENMGAQPSEFLTYFVDGGTHTRGAALYVAMVENLDKIALGEFTAEDLVTAAEEHLGEVQAMNFESVQAIVQNFASSKEELLERTFASLPLYVKHIISAIELSRRAKTVGDDTTVPYTLSLEAITYQPSPGQYFSSVLKDIRAGKVNVTKHNEKLKLFGFEVTQDLQARIETWESFASVRPLGSLGSLGSRFGEGTASEHAPEKTPESPKTPKEDEDRLIRRDTDQGEGLR